MATSCLQRFFSHLLAIFSLALLTYNSSIHAQDTHVIIDDWSVSQLYALPNPSCCINPSGCPLLTSNSTALNELSVQYSSSNRNKGYAWSAGAPCNIIGSYRDIGLSSDGSCQNANGNTNCSTATPLYSSAKVIPQCSSLLVQGNTVNGQSQTISSTSLIYDFGSLGKGFSNVDSTGLGNSNLISNLGLNPTTGIRIGAGPILIPVCHKNGGPQAGMNVAFYFTDGTSYIADATSYNSAISQTNTATSSTYNIQDCPSVDSNITTNVCPVFDSSKANYSLTSTGPSFPANRIAITLPSTFQVKKLGAIKLEFFNVSKLYLGKIIASCSVNGFDSSFNPKGNRVFSCTENVLACLPATATPTATATNTATNTATCTPTSTATPTATVTRTPTKTPTATPSRTPTITPTSTASPTITATFTATNTPVSTPTKTPTASPTGIKDCNGIANGTAKIDRCGVCNGDGQSCIGCQSVNIEGTQLALDINANQLRNNVVKINKQLSIAANNAKLSKKEISSINNYIKNSGIQAENLYHQVWQKTYTDFPKVIVSCTAIFCVNVSTTSNKTSIQNANDALIELSKQGESKVKAILKTAKTNKATKLKTVAGAATLISKLVKESINMGANSKSSLSKIPGSQSSCN